MRRVRLGGPLRWSVVSFRSSLAAPSLSVLFFHSGFASGDPVKDTIALRQFAQDGHQFAVAQSFSKNFGLYGQRVGCLSVVCENAAERSNVESQLKIIARAMYSNPPISGSRVVTTVLNDPALRKQWEQDVKVSGRCGSGRRQRERADASFGVGKVLLTLRAVSLSLFASCLRVFVGDGRPYHPDASPAP